MWHSVLAQLRFRPGRAVALLAALVVAVTSFAVLTATAQTQQLEVNGTVDTNDRGAYDLLVRPTGSRTALESQQGLVSSTAMTGLSGGISTAQWKQVLAIPGVYAAAPVAIVGYDLSAVDLPVDLSTYVKPGGAPQLWRVSSSLVSERGLTSIPTGDVYIYVTGQSLTRSDGGIMEGQAGGGTVPVCSGTSSIDAATNRSSALTIFCGSTSADDTVNPPGGANPGGTGTSGEPTAVGDVTWYFPYLVEAVDPVQEARLDGLDKAVTKGSYFTAGQQPVVSAMPGAAGGGRQVSIPVLLSNSASMDESMKVTISQMPSKDATLAAGDAGSTNLGDTLAGAAGTAVGHSAFSAQQAYNTLVGSLSTNATPAPGTAFADDNFTQYLSAQPISYSDAKGPESSLSAVPVKPQTLFDPDIGGGELADHSDLADTAVRTLNQHLSLAYSTLGSTAPVPVMTPVGQFDPEKMATTQSGLGAVPMETYFAPQATGADAASQSALGGKSLLPNSNVAGLLSVPPSMITTLSSLSVLQDSKEFSGVTPALGVDAAKPISVIRVKLTGSLGTDALSRRRVQLVAQEIHDRTGLDVDVTMGSSPTPVKVTDPAGTYGRPVLTLDEMWSRKGVAVTIADAVDRKSLLLFILVLTVCALFVTGATSAAVRTRRTELGVLACLGWPARRLFGLILAEVTTMGAVAGLAGAALAFPAGHFSGVHVTAGRALLAVPAAVALAALAALWPAWRAARAHPGEAVRPAVSARAHRVRVRGQYSLAWANLRRVPGRTLLGATALAAGTAALVALIGISTAFHGAVAGSLLGDAITVQVRSSDYTAAVIAALLGSATIADVLYTNTHDRASEYALLHSTGWSDRAVTRLVLTEAALTAAGGAAVGAGLALACDAALTGRVASALVWTAVAAVPVATAVSVLAAVLPARALRRAPASQLLAEG